MPRRTVMWPGIDEPVLGIAPLRRENPANTMVTGFDATKAAGRIAPAPVQAMVRPAQLEAGQRPITPAPVLGNLAPPDQNTLAQEYAKVQALPFTPERLASVGITGGLSPNQNGPTTIEVPAIRALPGQRPAAPLTGTQIVNQAIQPMPQQALSPMLRPGMPGAQQAWQPISPAALSQYVAEQGTQADVIRPAPAQPVGAAAGAQPTAEPIRPAGITLQDKADAGKAGVDVKDLRRVERDLAAGRPGARKELDAVLTQYRSEKDTARTEKLTKEETTARQTQLTAAVEEAKTAETEAERQVKDLDEGSPEREAALRAANEARRRTDELRHQHQGFLAGRAGSQDAGPQAGPSYRPPLRDRPTTAGGRVGATVQAAMQKKLAGALYGEEKVVKNPAYISAVNAIEESDMGAAERKAALDAIPDPEYMTIQVDAKSRRGILRPGEKPTTEALTRAREMLRNEWNEPLTGKRQADLDEVGDRIFMGWLTQHENDPEMKEAVAGWARAHPKEWRKYRAETPATVENTPSRITPAPAPAAGPAGPAGPVGPVGPMPRMQGRPGETVFPPEEGPITPAPAAGPAPAPAGIQGPPDVSVVDKLLRKYKNDRAAAKAAYARGER